MESKVNIVLLVKDGARWKDASGAPVCNFPSYDIIRSLPESVQAAFDSKAITHSDEYYQVSPQSKIPQTLSLKLWWPKRICRANHPIASLYHTIIAGP